MTILVIAASNSNKVKVVNVFVAVAVGFQANSAAISVSEDDGLVTFTLDIIGPVDPASVTTVYLSVLSDTAGKACTYSITHNLLIVQ